jgi:penicillin-binding protein 1B
VWSGIFSRLPSAALKVADKGLDWQWVVNSNSTDPTCPGAQRVAFVAGFAPAYQPCVYADPDADPYYQQQQDQSAQEAQQAPRSGWRNWFGLGRNEPARPPEPQPAPSAPPPPPPPPDQQ